VVIPGTKGKKWYSPTAPKILLKCPKKSPRPFARAGAFGSEKLAGLLGAVLFGVGFAGVAGVLGGVVVVSRCRMGVMGSLFVVTTFVVLGGFGVVLGGLGVVGGGLFVAFGGFLGHGVES